MSGFSASATANSQQIDALKLERNILNIRQAGLIRELFLMVDRNPMAAGHFAAVVGSAAWMEDQSLSQSDREALAALAVIGGVLCLIDYDCRMVASKMIEISNDADEISDRLGHIDSRIAYLQRAAVRPATTRTAQFHLKNSCKYPVSFGLKYKNANGKWITESWWNADSGQSFYPIVSKSRLALASKTIAYYAETQKGNPKVVWDGDHAMKFGSRSVSGRVIELSKDGAGRYALNLTCSSS